MIKEYNKASLEEDFKVENRSGTKGHHEDFAHARIIHSFSLPPSLVGSRIERALKKY
jgi:hypothetical protein